MSDHCSAHPRHSLENLLRTEVRAAGWELALVATADGFLVATSRGPKDPTATELAAHLSNGRLTAGWGEGIRSHLQISTQPLSVCGSALFLAVSHAPGRPTDLVVLGGAVQHILAGNGEMGQDPSARPLAA